MKVLGWERLWSWALERSCVTSGGLSEVKVDRFKANSLKEKNRVDHRGESNTISFDFTSIEICLIVSGSNFSYLTRREESSNS
jgi:hypothetical protein